jgi:hypothetical protein
MLELTQPRGSANSNLEKDVTDDELAHLWLAYFPTLRHAADAQRHS